MATLDNPPKRFRFAALIASSASDDELNSNQPPAYESRPSSLHIERQVIKGQPRTHNRLGSIKRYFHSVDLRRTANRSENQDLLSHRKAISVDIGKQLSNIIRNSGVNDERAIGTDPFTSPKEHLLAQAIVPMRTISPEPMSVSSNPTQVKELRPPLSPTKACIPTSSTISEGMLDPRHLCNFSLRPKEHRRLHSDQLLSPGTTLKSLVIPSVSTGRTKGSSFIRPISLLFNKSADFLTDRLSASAISTPTSSRNDSFYFHADRAGNINTKSNAWSKFVNGYVSPKTSRILPRSLKMSKTRERDDVEDYLEMKSGKRARLQGKRMVTQGENKTDSRAPFVPIKMPDAATGNQRVQFFLSFVAVEGLLLWVCPPYSAVALGGNGMFVVYAIMMLALAAIARLIVDYPSTP